MCDVLVVVLFYSYLGYDVFDTVCSCLNLLGFLYLFVVSTYQSGL